MYVCVHRHVYCPQRSEEVAGSPGTGVTGVCEPPCGAFARAASALQPFLQTLPTVTVTRGFLHGSPGLHSLCFTSRWWCPAGCGRPGWQQWHSHGCIHELPGSRGGSGWPWGLRWHPLDPLASDPHETVNWSENLCGEFPLQITLFFSTVSRLSVFY